MGLDGHDQEATDDEALYGREYLDWKKQTLGAQASHHLNCNYDTTHTTTHDNNSDDDEDKEEWIEEEHCANVEEFYKLEMAFGYVKKGSKSKGKFKGLVVEGGYMFVLDPDMSLFPLVTWHCPKYKEQGCPASFTTRVTNPETVRTGLQGRTGNIQVARANNASHVMENLECIEDHANHRPGHYKDNISPLIHGLFSRQCREASSSYICHLLNRINCRCCL